MSKNRGMSRLRKDKRRLEAQIAQEKVEIFAEVEKYKNSLWPFKVLSKFRKTAESLSESKLLVIGAQLAYAAINTVKERNPDDESGEQKGGIKEFLKSMANNFLQQYMNKKEEEEETNEE
jgi:hypothetical protein